MPSVDAAAVEAQVAQYSQTIIKFLREIVRHPVDGFADRPGRRTRQEEMRKLGFDEVWFDSMGNTVGRIGNGPRVLVYDSHIDTVGIGNPDEWDWDPFIGKSGEGPFLCPRRLRREGQHAPHDLRLAIAASWGCWTAGRPTTLATWKSGATASPPRLCRARRHPP
jgi:hypothetical protein